MKIYADGSDPDEMVAAIETVSGFTTNPTLMRKAGITDYESFAKDVISKIPSLPISFEVFADDLDGMESQAQKLASFGDNVYVKIPVTNTKGISTAPLISRLSGQGIKINVTAVFTCQQIDIICEALQYQTPAILSIFAGRIADTGRDPKEYIRYGLHKAPQNVEVLWASCREVYNIVEAADVGCHIITVPNSILAKLKLTNKDLTEYSLETVKMFYNDAVRSGFTL